MPDEALPGRTRRQAGPPTPASIRSILSALVKPPSEEMTPYPFVWRLRRCSCAVLPAVQKGAAVAAAEYLQNTFPETAGFSPRSLRRMREFYRIYESAPEIMNEAMSLGWTQNIVILEADLTVRERLWYIRAALRFDHHAFLPVAGETLLVPGIEVVAIAPIVRQVGIPLPADQSGLWIIQHLGTLCPETFDDDLARLLR